MKLKALSIWLVWFGILYLGGLIFIPLMFSIFRNEPLDIVGLFSLTDGRGLLLAVCAFLVTVGTLILWAMPIHLPVRSFLFGAFVATALLPFAGVILYFLASDFESRAGLVGFLIMLLIPNGLAGAYACHLRSRIS